MSTLVIVEHYNGKIQPSTRETVSAALELSKDPVLLLAGYCCESAAQEAAALAGVKLVYWVDDPCYEHQLAENTSQLVASLATSFNHILAPSNTFGKNLLPRVAAMFGMTQVSDVIRIINKTRFDHTIYAGNAIETVDVLDEKVFLTIRTTAFKPNLEEQTPCPIERIHTVFPLRHSMLVERQVINNQRPDLRNAKIVVSGGRGLQSKENFKLIEELADILGAAIGASRAAVDAGFISNEHQIGQTGKTIAPKLYIAIGISGAIQHIAGMKESKIIIAINKDVEAPIFKIASYGLVGDLFEIVPQLIEKLKLTASK